MCVWVGRSLAGCVRACVYNKKNKEILKCTIIYISFIKIKQNMAKIFNLYIYSARKSSQRVFIFP